MHSIRLCFLILAIAGTASKGHAADGAGLRLNEILADPGADLAGDANGDGIRDSSDDEFVEFMNMAPVTIDIAGWSLRDSTEVRHVFPDSIPLLVAPGAMVTVFGGGTPTGIEGLVCTASTGRLALNNSRDVVTLLDGSGAPVDVHEFGSEGGHDVSMVRIPDGHGVWMLAGEEGSIAPFSPGRLNQSVAAILPSTWGGLKEGFQTP